MAKSETYLLNVYLLPPWIWKKSVCPNSTNVLSDIEWITDSRLIHSFFFFRKLIFLKWSVNMEKQSPDKSLKKCSHLPYGIECGELLQVGTGVCPKCQGRTCQKCSASAAREQKYCSNCGFELFSYVPLQTGQLKIIWYSLIELEMKLLHHSLAYLVL